MDKKRIIRTTFIDYLSIIRVFFGKRGIEFSIEIKHHILLKDGVSSSADVFRWKN